MDAHLTAEEEAALISEAQAGSQRAMEALLRAYDAWLRKLARQRARTTSTDVEDLYQEGRLAFVLAVRRDKGGARLYTFARDAVMGAMYAEGTDFPVQVPARSFTRYWKFIRENETAEDAAEAAARSGEMTASTFWGIHWAANSKSVSLDSPPASSRSQARGRRPQASMDGSGRTTLADTLTEDDLSRAVENAQDRQQAHDLLGRLEGRERDVVAHAMGFATGFPMTDEEVALALGMTRPTVQRVRVSALEKLR